jgi:hypothetical protein
MQAQAKVPILLNQVRPTVRYPTDNAFCGWIITRRFFSFASMSAFHRPHPAGFADSDDKAPLHCENVVHVNPVACSLVAIATAGYLNT